jgi:flavin reductase (DIM6/NTAB) family NADH-FMN oxidoreductase RutF
MQWAVRASARAGKTGRYEMQIDAAGLSDDASYKLLTGCVTPRPIAWVNCGRRSGEQKDTSRNINALKEYVVNIADESLLEELHSTSENFSSDISEIDVAGLTTAPSAKIATPRLKEAPISMECVLRHVLNFGTSGSEFFVGEVVAFHIRDDLYRDGKIDTRLLRPICRLGGPNYATLGDIVTLRTVPT